MHWGQDSSGQRWRGLHRRGLEGCWPAGSATARILARSGESSIGLAGSGFDGLGLEERSVLRNSAVGSAIDCFGEEERSVLRFGEGR
jgi:hypothetical protein